jgi:hypothetical protein
MRKTIPPLIILTSFILLPHLTEGKIVSARLKLERLCCLNGRDQHRKKRIHRRLAAKHVSLNSRGTGKLRAKFQSLRMEKIREKGEHTPELTQDSDFFLR